MKHLLLIIFLTTVCYVNPVFSQDSIDTKLMLGKWEIDIMRDDSDNAIDLASEPNTDMPDILPYMTFKTKKVLLQYGGTKWKGKWYIKDNKLFIDTQNNISLSYVLVKLTNDNLTLKHTLDLISDEKMIIKIFYKKI